MNLKASKCLLIVLFVLSTIPSSADSWTDSGNYDTSWYDDLSESFDISTAEQLAGWVYLNNNGTSFEGKTLNLTANIDLSAHYWTPVGSFTGTLNGNFYKVSGLNCYVVGSSSSKIPYGGFIRFCYGNVGNLELSGSVTVKSTYKYLSVYAGGLCYYNYGNISNCVIDCEVSASRAGLAGTAENTCAGGVCCINKGVIRNCVNMGDVTATAASQDHGFSNDGCVDRAGGIASSNGAAAQIINCCNYGEVYSKAGYYTSKYDGYLIGYSGGICGSNSGTICNGFNVGDITAYVSSGSSTFAGGIVGNNSGTVESTYYSSSASISGGNINTTGLQLSQSQMTNTTYEFTSLLNSNVEDLSDTDVSFWANASSVDDNLPFLLNGFAITDLSISDVSPNEATFTASPSDIESSAITAKGFEYRLSTDATYQRVYASDSFTVSVAGLSADNAYEVRAFITTSNGNTIYFDSEEFSTAECSVETKECTNITATSATLNGNLTVGTTAIKSMGFLWRDASDAAYSVVYAEGQDFSYQLDGLSPNTIYYYQAFVLTEDGDNIYGDIMTFTTSPISFELSDDASSGMNSITVYGSNNINISTDIVVEYKDATVSSYNSTTAESDEDGDFECTLSDLTANTYYDVRAYFIYNGSYYYTSIHTYKTLNVIIQTLTPLVDTSVTLRGDVEGASSSGKVGFEYRDANYPDAIASNVVYSTIPEETMFTSTIYDVTNGNEYKYRAFYQDEDDTYTYGDWVSFTPTDVDGIMSISVDEDDEAQYFNIQGCKISEPQQGVIIVRFRNGTTKKILKE